VLLKFSLHSAIRWKGCRNQDVVGSAMLDGA
jgi:hypothetical protein